VQYLILDRRVSLDTAHTDARLSARRLRFANWMLWPIARGVCSQYVRSLLPDGQIGELFRVLAAMLAVERTAVSEVNSGRRRCVSGTIMPDLAIAPLPLPLLEVLLVVIEPTMRAFQEIHTRSAVFGLGYNARFWPGVQHLK